MGIIVTNCFSKHFAYVTNYLGLNAMCFVALLSINQELFPTFETRVATYNNFEIFVVVFMWFFVSLLPK
jgi:hypothetical protein